LLVVNFWFECEPIEKVFEKSHIFDLIPKF